MLSLFPAELFVASTVKWGLVAPVIVASLAIVIFITIAAARGNLHMPAYIGIAILAFLVSVIFGEVSGARPIAGSFVGIAFSIACFLSIAVGVGSLLALAFYREPPAL